MNEIILSPIVAEQLEQLRVEGRYNMFDFNGIQSRANECGFFDCVTWMEDNKSPKWRLLVMNGFMVQDGYEVLSRKEYFKKNPVKVEVEVEDDASEDW